MLYNVYIYKDQPEPQKINNDIINFLDTTFNTYYKLSEGAFGVVYLVMTNDTINIIKIEKKSNSRMSIDSPGLKIIREHYVNDYVVEVYEFRGKNHGNSFIKTFLFDLHKIHELGFQHCDLHPGNISLNGHIIDNGLVSKLNQSISTYNLNLHDGSSQIHEFYDYNCLRKWNELSDDHFMLLNKDFFEQVKSKQIKFLDKLSFFRDIYFKDLPIKEKRLLYASDKDSCPDPTQEAKMFDELDSYINQGGRFQPVLINNKFEIINLNNHIKLSNNLIDRHNENKSIKKRILRLMYSGQENLNKLSDLKKIDNTAIDTSFTISELTSRLNIINFTFIIGIKGIIISDLKIQLESNGVQVDELLITHGVIRLKSNNIIL
jgi:hypothetical protein